MSLEVDEVRVVDDELVEAFARLLPQLSATAEPLDSEGLQRLVEHEATTLLVARLDGEIVGTLTLVAFPIPTGLRSWIEDVVVDEAARGHGVGAALTLEAVRKAAQMQTRTVDLTSRPSRAAANRLYERLGFCRRESIVYRFAGSSPPPDLAVVGSQPAATSVQVVHRTVPGRAAGMGHFLL